MRFALTPCENIEVIEEFVYSGLSGESAKRPGFSRMVAQATDGSKLVETVVMFRLARTARNMRIFSDALDALGDAGVEVVSITENFGEGRSKRIGQTISAMIAEQQAIDASIYTMKSRRENDRQGVYNGGPIAYGYETYVTRPDGQNA